MSLTFLGAKNIGNKSGDGALVWNANIDHTGADGLPLALIPPVLPGTVVKTVQLWKFTLNPSTVQAAFDFGNIRKIRIVINRDFGWIVTQISNTIPGRVWIEFTSSGDVFSFSPPLPLIVVLPPLGFEFNDMYDSENFEAKIHANASSVVNVYIEPDFINGSYAAESSTTLNISLYNFE
jgi:hypothetical protein